MSKEDYINRVISIAEHKYELDPEVMLAFAEEITFCWDNDFGPIRAVEFIAAKIF